MTGSLAIGDHLRNWRQRRRMSQLDLACEADISTRHLSFLETGRARPSRDMVLHLAERLDVPLRQRNVLLIAAGYAPVFAERALDHPALAPARAAVDQVLAGHEPYPALAVDRHWQLVAANPAAQRLMAGVAPHLLQPPVNVMRVALHPEGLAPLTENLAEWRGHLLDRLARQVETTGDPALATLSEELARYPAPSRRPVPPAADPVVLPLRLRFGDATLAFFSTTTVFGTPNDITLSELAVEAFFPADAATAEMLRAMAATPP
jgi:transcriptional regulator with XRE-family HTH domain